MGATPPAMGEDMTDIFGYLDDRAAVTPSLTAVRLAGEPVTYGELHESTVAYEQVAAAQGLSEASAMAAALMSLLPARLRELSPTAQGEWVGAAMGWLEERALVASGHTLGEAV